MTDAAPTLRTAAQREADFRADFAALLAKHDAEFHQVTDDRKPYGLHNGVAIVSMQSEYAADGTLRADYTEFNL
jgi:hypothetical protein